MWRDVTPSRIVLIVIVLTRLVAILFAQSLGGDDGHRYLLEGTNLWQHGTFSSEQGPSPNPTAHDLPLFPMILAGLIAIFRDPLIAARVAAVLNAALFAVAAMGVGELAMFLGGSARIATLAIALFASYPDSLPYSVFYMPESLFLALFVWSNVMLLKTGRQGCLPHLEGYRLAFLLWGLSVMAKPISLFWGPLVALLLIARVYLRHRRVTAVPIAGMTLGGSVFVPWMIRNYLAFGVIGLTSITGTNLFDYNYRYLLEEQGFQDVQAILDYRAREAREPNEMARAEHLATIAEAQILAHPIDYAMTTIKRQPDLYLYTAASVTLRMFGDNDGAFSLVDVTRHPGKLTSAPLRAVCLQSISWAFLIVAYAASLAGLWRLAHTGNRFALTVILMLFLYFAAIYGPVTGSRYRMPMLPALSISAAIGLLRRAASEKC